MTLPTRVNHQTTMRSPPNAIGRTIIFIDDAHTFGGAQIALACAIGVLLDDHEICIVCVCAPATEEAVRKVAKDNSRLRFISCPPALPLNIFSFPLRIPAFWRIIGDLQKEQPYSWWLNLAGIEFCLAAQTALRFKGLKHIAWLHNAERFAYFNQRGTWPRRALSRLRDAVADRWLFKRYPLLIAPSRSTAAELTRRFRKAKQQRVEFMYCPGIQRYTPVRESLESVPADLIDIWMIGRVEYGHKNNQAALDVLHALAEPGHRVHLNVVGDGPDMTDFRAQVAASPHADKVSLLGWKADPWLGVPNGAIIFVPSHYETMSIVAREALARGLRLTASPIPVFGEWIPNVLLADDFTTAAFAARLLEVHAMPHEQISTLYAAALALFSDDAFRQTFRRFTQQD
jgi:glycosyltransferase involved in cell wall biosynthesis